MFNYHNEDAEYEFNARYDYAREAYGDAAEFNRTEAYYDYLDECEREGDAPLDRAAWEAGCAANRPFVPFCTNYADTDEIPF